MADWMLEQVFDDRHLDRDVQNYLDANLEVIDLDAQEADSYFDE